MILNLWSYIFNDNYVQGVEYPTHGHYKYNCFKHFDMFVVEATDNLRNYLFLDGRFQELFYSSTGSCRIFFFFDRQFAGIFLFFDKPLFEKILMHGTWFLILSIVFIHEFCDKMSNRNIPNPNKNNRQLFARLWDEAKWRGDGKCYCSCTQCRRFKRIRILISTTTKNCREHGHAEGGNKYCPFVGLAL